MRTLSLSIGMVVLFAAFTISVHGQNPGSITGTAKDSNGGVLPGASVTVINPAKAITQKAETNEQGDFVFPQLPPGTYTITVEKAGFKKVEKANVVLSTGDKLNAGDFELEPGDLSATVQVEADAGQLQIKSESGERSDLVSNKQLRDIALNGRNVVDYLKLVPGVISGGTRTTSTVTNITDGFSINGTRTAQHEYTVDGVTNLNLGNNTGGLVSVNPDALEEVKVLTSNYQAEYGRSGGGFIALTTRGGTNDYHGGGRYFRRHDSLNSNSYFNNANGLARPLYRFNYYGWDFGGPIIFPRFGEGGPAIWNGKQKLFFFISQEYYRQLVPQQNAVNIRVPTAAERAGIFAQTIIDPVTGKAFASNMIPANRIYAPGQAILNLFPAPNTSGTYNYTSVVPSSYPRRENIVRIDWQIDSNTRLSGRWIYNKDDQQFAYGTTTASWNWPLTITDRANGPGNVLSFTLTHNFSSTVINEFVFGAGRGGVNISPKGDAATRAATGINTPLLYPNVNTAGLIPGITLNGIPGVANSSTNTAGGGNLGAPQTSVFGTFDQHFVINTFIDNLTKVSGKHTLKFGWYYQRASNSSNSQTNAQSIIDFSTSSSNPLNTGNPFANALLGVYTSYTQASAKPLQSYFYQDLSFYAQDTWKVTPRLTLDLGLRLSHYQPVYNLLGPATGFNPALFDPAKAPRIYKGVCITVSPCSVRAIDPAFVGVPTPANTLPSTYVGRLVPNTGDLLNGEGQTTSGYPKGLIHSIMILPQPRLGFAWDATKNHKTVVRGGFGVTFDRYQSGITGFGATNPPAVLNPTLTNGYLQDLTSAGASNALPPPPFAVNGVDVNAKWPTIYTYSIGVQRDVGKGFVVDVTYVGSQTRHNARRVNLNSLPYGTTFKPGSQDPTKFNGTIPTAEPGLPSIYSSAGVNFSGANALPVDFLRPYQGYSDITYYQFDSNSHYNSLQINVQRRFSKGVSLGIAYNRSRAVGTVSDDGTFTNLVNTKNDYALLNFDRTNYFVANYVWDLPKGSKPLGGSMLSRAVLDNWQLSGITWLASGNPTELTLTITGQDAGNRLLGTYTAGNNSGQQPRFYLTGDPQSGNRINESAFVLPAIGDKGPYPRMYLRNPGIRNQDLSIFKNFPIGAERKQSLQLRIEAFNIFNHTQFSGFNLTTNVTNGAGQNGGNIFANYTGLSVVPVSSLRSGSCTGILGRCFGEPNTARDPRIIQLGLKFYF